MLNYRLFDYDRNLLPNKYLAEMDKGTSIEEATKHTGYTIGFPGWNLLYYSVFCSLRRNNFNLMIETGSNWGFSTIVIAQAIKDSGFEGMVHSVELKEENFNKAQKNIKNAGLEKYVTLYNDDSCAFLKAFVQDDKKITFAFIDGDHRKQTVLNEFKLIFPNLDNKSTVFFDNTYPIDLEDGRVFAAVQEIQSTYGGNLINFENSSWSTPGHAIWQKNPFH